MTIGRSKNFSIAIFISLVMIMVLGTSCGQQAVVTPATATPVLPAPVFSPNAEPAQKSAALNGERFEDVKLIAGDASADDGYGWEVALEGDIAVAGALFDEGMRGAAYVYVRDASGWSQQAKLVSADGSGGDEFGAAVDVDGDTIAVGAPFNETFSGAAYVFVRQGDTWVQDAKITADVVTPYDEYASSLAIDGGILAIGNPLDDDAANASGSVHIYVRDGGSWVQEAKLTASDAKQDDNLGRYVDFRGDTVVAGAPNHDGQGIGSGAAYVFVRNTAGWSEQAKLEASDAEAGDDFGRAVAVYGNTILVAAKWEDEGGDNAGAVYVFQRNASSWSQGQKLTASDAMAGDNFGRSVAVYDDTIVIGASRKDAKGENSGAAYLFKREGDVWIEKVKLYASDAARLDEFGRAAAVYEGTVIVGAPFNDHVCPENRYCEAGGAYVFGIESD